MISAEHIQEIKKDVDISKVEKPRLFLRDWLKEKGYEISRELITEVAKELDLTLPEIPVRNVYRNLEMLNKRLSMLSNNIQKPKTEDDKKLLSELSISISETAKKLEDIKKECCDFCNPN